METLMIPKHVAIIPDGNRRWARSHKLIAWKGHEMGVKNAEEVMRSAFDKGVVYFTFWAASLSNLLKRSKSEVAVLVRLLKSYVKKFLDSGELIEKQIHFQIVGQGLQIIRDKKLDELVKKLENQTKNFSKHFVTILFGYDGQEEMLEAISKVKSQKSKVTDKNVRAALTTGFLPDVDLAIRTGGEPHWSAGFLMWLTANSQFYFTNKFWPEFSQKELEKAFIDYSRRERRMGK